MSDHTQYTPAQAEAVGLVVIRSDIRHLMVDIDTPGANVNPEARAVLQAKGHVGPASEDRVTVSPSGGTHVYLKLLRPVGGLPRLAMQAALGSDGEHEALNVFNVLANFFGADLVLYETAEAGAVVNPWLDEIYNRINP